MIAGTNEYNVLGTQKCKYWKHAQLSKIMIWQNLIFLKPNWIIFEAICNAAYGFWGQKS